MATRRTFWRGGVCAAGLAAVCLTGCSEDPGLQERVNRLQAEMQEKDRQLQDAQANLERTKSDLKSARAAANRTPAPEARSTPAFLPKDQLDDSYTAASKELQRRVTGELKNYAVEDCIEYPVVMPTDERPYRSKVVLLVRSDAGRSYRLEFPVSADPSGKWAFPSATDVAGALADTRTQDANNTAANNGPVSHSSPTNNPRPSGQNTPPVIPGQTASETHVIDWGDGHSTHTGNRPPTNGSAPSPVVPRS